MQHNRLDIFEKAKVIIVKNRLFFIEDIVSLLPISKPTFYSYFPIDSNEFYELKELLDENRVTTKISMRKKWHDSDNATLQITLMKLICTPEERKAMSMTHTDVTTDGEKITTVAPQVFASLIPLSGSEKEVSE